MPAAVQNPVPTYCLSTPEHVVELLVDTVDKSILLLRFYYAGANSAELEIWIPGLSAFWLICAIQNTVIYITICAVGFTMLFVLYSVDLQHYNRDPTYMNYIENFCFANESSELITSMNVPVLSNIPKSFFLAEHNLIELPEDEGHCGSCYIFSSRNQLTSMLMHDYPYYEYLDISEPYQNIMKQKDSVSVEFLLNESWSTNFFCNGGNYIDVVSHLISTKMKTVELTSHFPYVSFSSMNTSKDLVAELKDPMIPPSKYIIPMYFFAKGEDDCPLSVFEIRASNELTGWSEAEVRVIKSTIARGFAVQTEVNSESGSYTSYQRYVGGILKGDCKASTANHEVAIVGYGKYKGTDVWVMSNSWGTLYGVSGFYYVQIGSNAYCHERIAHVMMSRYWNIEGEDVGFLESQLYEENKNLFRSILSIRIKRGYNGLDEDNGYYMKMWSWESIFVLCLFLLPTIYLLYLLLLYVFCINKFQRVNECPVNLVATDQMEEETDWLQNCVIGLITEGTYKQNQNFKYLIEDSLLL